jgi:hypothetical protein
VEWDSGKRYGQGQEIIRPGNDQEMGDSTDVYDDIFLEPMDVD